MNSVTLGRTGLEVSPIAFGTWQLGGEWGGFDEQRAVAAIRRGARAGVDLFDTAQGYGFGASEPLLGGLSATISTTAATRSDRHQGRAADDRRRSPSRRGPDFLRSALEDSLRALEVDQIPIYQVHWPDPGVPIRRGRRGLDALVREEGPARRRLHYAVTEIAEFAETRPVETLQPPYHLFRREVERSVLSLRSRARHRRLVYGPLAHGPLTGTMDETPPLLPTTGAAGAPCPGRGLPRNLEIVSRISAPGRR